MNGGGGAARAATPIYHQYLTRETGTPKPIPADSSYDTLALNKILVLRYCRSADGHLQHAINLPSFTPFN